MNIISGVQDLTIVYTDIIYVMIIIIIMVTMMIVDTTIILRDVVSKN